VEGVVNLGKILIVDDDAQIRRVLRVLLTREEYECAEASSGEESLRKLNEFQPDLVLLDMNLPGLGGLDTCRAMRAMSKVPIILLTVRDDETDKVEALDAGGDDYITKPFAREELLARIRAALRRAPVVSTSSSKLVFEGFEIDFETRRVRKDGQVIRLTPKEYDLLRYLISHKGKPVSHAELLQEVWGADHEEQRSLLRVFITTLRSKIEPDPGTPKYILTDPWLGYRFADFEGQK
jgi:two-component system KDP operon response regulator KdpE